MVTILSIGLVVALGGPLLYVLATKKFSFNSLSLPGRLPLWLLAAIALVIAAHSDDAWLSHIGVEQFGGHDLVSTVVAIIAMLVGAVVLQVLLTKLGFKDKNKKGRSYNRKFSAFRHRIGSSSLLLRR